MRRLNRNLRAALPPPEIAAMRSGTPAAASKWYETWPTEIHRGGPFSPQLKLLGSRRKPLARLGNITGRPMMKNRVDNDAPEAVAIGGAVGPQTGVGWSMS